MGQMTEHPRGRDTSRALTEVRAVLGRAQTALYKLTACPTEAEWSDTIRDVHRYDDPDADAIRDDLRVVVERLNRWRRTGRPTKGLDDDAI